MAIIKYVPDHKEPQNTIRYIAKAGKTKNGELITGINTSEEPENAVSQFAFMFEHFSGRRFDVRTDGGAKQEVRLHHYVQSFKPDEATPEQAHKIGVEWAKKMFGEKRQILVSTHTDKSHIHNHIIVSAYDFSGKKWYSNKATLKKCREESDRICKKYGLSIIDKPKWNVKSTYGEWLAKQRCDSWKDRLREDIDRLILSENVNNLDDLLAELEKEGVSVNRGKYISLKPKRAKHPIRIARLGDGYSRDDLEYRILQKNRIMTEAEMRKLGGIQLDTAFIIRQMQIIVFRRTEDFPKVTFFELRKNAELLTFLTENKITLAKEFQERVDRADEKVKELRRKKSDIQKRISDNEKLIQDNNRFNELLAITEKRSLTADEFAEYDRVKYTLDIIDGSEDIEKINAETDRLKRELEAIGDDIISAEKERTKISDMYKTFLRQSKSDYDFLRDKIYAERDIEKAGEHIISDEEIYKYSTRR